MGEMALHLHLFSPPSTRLSTATTAAATPMSKLMRKSVNLQSRSFQVLQLCKHVGVYNRETLIVRASADIDGADSSAANPPEEAKAEASVEKLPLECKQQLLEANKLRMKLAKKVRLRRKRLQAHTEKEGKMATFKDEEKQECMTIGRVTLNRF